MPTNFNIGLSACPSSVRATRDDSRIVFIFFSFSGKEIVFKGINSCTKPKALEIATLPVFMAERYFVTNPVCSMMIKNVSSTAIVEANGAIIVLRRYVSFFMNIPSQNNNIYYCVCEGIMFRFFMNISSQNNNIHLGILGFGFGIPNNLCCIQTIQITIQITDAGRSIGFVR